MKIIEVNDLTVFSKDGTTQVLRDVNFNINEKEFLGILGPSGCGKSTLLKVMSGLEKPSYGEILFKGALVEEPTKDIAIVFQHSALLPWKSILENVRLPVEARGFDLEKSRAISMKFIKKVGLKGFENSFPRDISEGMRHAASLARALAMDPDVILMDEPFSSLDAFGADKLRKLTLQIWKSLKAHASTFVLVTHSVEEAVFMCDRILVMSHRPGKIIKDIKIDIPRPRERYARGKKFFRYCDNIKALMAPKQRAKNGHQNDKNNNNRGK